MKKFTFLQKKSAVLRKRNGEKASELSKEIGTTKKSIYQWANQYEDDGDRGLMPQSKTPKSSPNETPAPLQKRVVKLKRDHPDWSLTDISNQLHSDGSGLDINTIKRILKVNSSYFKLSKDGKKLWKWDWSNQNTSAYKRQLLKAEVKASKLTTDELNEINIYDLMDDLLKSDTKATGIDLLLDNLNIAMDPDRRAKIMAKIINKMPTTTIKDELRLAKLMVKNRK